MREIALAEAAALNLTIALEEVNDPLRLMRFNPLSLPQLHIGGELAASGNPPKPAEVRRLLQAASPHI